MTDEERRNFAVPPLQGEYDGLDLALLDRTDPDERRFLIEAEHPELHAALRSGRREIQLDGETMSPGLHIAMHEIVANQLWDGDPPQAWETAKRLLDAGYERHEVLHMLGSVVAGELFEVMNARRPADRDRMCAAFAALPGSWEQDRTAKAERRHANRAERRAAERRRRH